MSAIPEEVLGLRVEVVRSRRRTAALHIVGNELQVRVPKQIRDESIIEILQKKRPWIRRKVVQLKEVPVPQPKEFVNGEAFPFLGQNFRLKVQEGHRVGVQLSEGYLLTTVRPSEVGEQRKQRIQQYLKSWYRSRAEERLQEKVERYSKQIGVSPKGLRVREFKSKWGSCDSRGTIAFNLNLIKAPQPIVDYVVIHELCHMIQPNHSKNFWKEVEKYDASYKEHRAWLKQRAGELI